MSSLITSRFEHPNYSLIDNRIVSKKTNTILHIFYNDTLYSYNFFYMTLPNGSEYFIYNTYVKSKNIVQITVKNLSNNKTLTLLNKKILLDIVSVDNKDNYFVGLFDDILSTSEKSLSYSLSIFNNIFPNIDTIIRFDNIVDCINHEYYEYKFDKYFISNNKNIIINYNIRGENRKFMTSLI